MLIALLWSIMYIKFIIIYSLIRTKWWFKLIFLIKFTCPVTYFTYLLMDKLTYIFTVIGFKNKVCLRWKYLRWKLFAKWVILSLLNWRMGILKHFLPHISTTTKTHETFQNQRINLLFFAWCFLIKMSQNGEVDSGRKSVIPIKYLHILNRYILRK